MSRDFPAIAKALEYSTHTLASMRDVLNVKQLGEHCAVVATGSFGRKEASGESDVDFFLIHDEHADATEANRLRPEVATWIASVVPRAPSVDGAFNAVESIETMLNNVGGNEDQNQKITRRMLLLLEGTFLYNSALFERLRRRMVELYVRETITEHGLARFLLNDIIRYYRTMCVDFEYKTAEQKKPWGLRNLKLMYSRKLLYFGGVVAVAETAQKTRRQKVELLINLLNETPIARLQSLFGGAADTQLRSRLESVTQDRSTQFPEFRELKNDAQHFTWALERLLVSRYPPGHPIHTALIL
jgi:predicted nucleotidyltransferase